jgi:glycoprotein endo-alpha-1,2-mannosidase
VAGIDFSWDAMLTRLFTLLFVVGFFTACAPNSTIQPLNLNLTETSAPVVTTESATPEISSTEVEGPNPSYKVAAFYYPWYGNPSIDSQWIHWTQNNHTPPDDVASDYFPTLGAYSSNDPKVVAQHMKWLREAGIGVIITSWWGQGSREDRVVPLLLETAEQYGIKVAFHIEPYNGRTAESLLSDIKYIYEQYGSNPAFFLSTATSRYSPSDRPKGMFFVWSIQDQGTKNFSYWQKALDEIHALPEGGLVIANSFEAAWVENSHFDGLYNYATLHLEQDGGFAWARSLPPDSLYVPSVIPGFSAKRVGYAETTYVPREDGATFDTQWTSALGTGVEPAMVTITSFNEWHEGSMIEPPQFGGNDRAGYAYADFGTLPPEGYLTLTHKWIDKYLAITWPSAYRARIRVTTTSDWTTLNVVNGGAWIRPERVSTSDSATTAGMEAGDRLLLTQSLADAKAGKEVEMTWDAMLTNLVAGQDFILQIDRGNIGKTQVTIYNYMGSTPIEVKTFEWDKVTTGRNSFQITIPSGLLTNTSP